MSKANIFRNFSYLSILQVVNLIIPLLAYPYLVGKLGLILYGKYVYATALIAFLQVIVNYGFNISAIKELADKKNKVGDVVSSVLFSKAILLLFSLVVMLIFGAFVPFIGENRLLLLFCGLSLVGEVFNYAWYFQAKEDLSKITLIVSSIKIGAFLSYFIFIKDSGDMLFVALITGLSTLISSFSIFLLMLRDTDVELRFTGFSLIKNSLIEGFPFFFSRFFISIRERIAMIAIGSWLGFQYVSYLDLLQKITNALTIPIDMLNTVVYPRVIQNRNLKLSYISLGIVIIYSLVVYLLLLFIPFNKISIFGLNKVIQPVSGYFFLYGLIIPMQGIIYFTGNTILVIYGYVREFNSSVIFGGVVYLALLFLGNYFPMGLNEIALCMICSYLITIVTRCYYIKKYKLGYGRFFEVAR